MIGPFILTFLVVVFILLMQNMLKYFDDIVGKDLGWDVLGQLLFYMGVFMTPVALPLAVLLSSLITFGNLGEHFELTAIKGSGISLLRTLQPIFFFVCGLTVVAFYANNYLVPKAALEAYSLLYDIKQKKPALDLREGAFYGGIPDISIKVNKRYPDAKTIKGVVIYDHRRNDGNKEVTVADSGRMYTILNEQYLKLELFNGFRYEEGANSEQDVTGARDNSVKSLSRTKFAKSQIVFDLSSFMMTRTEKKWFQGNRIMRNLHELDGDVDSMNNEILAQRSNHYAGRTTFFSFYGKKDAVVLPAEIAQFKARRDSMISARNRDAENNHTTPGVLNPQLPTRHQAATMPPAKTAITDISRRYAPTLKPKANPVTSISKTVGKKPITPTPQNADIKKDTASLKPVVLSADSLQKLAKLKIKKDSITRHRLDSVIARKPTKDELQGAANTARQVKSQLLNTNTAIENAVTELRIFEIQWHMILANSLACIAMFLIGAPLGAIIKKGGLGVPFLVSILFFIVYYVMNIIGQKWAKQGSVSIVAGVWAPDVILLIIGLLFLRQARADARLFDTDFYLVTFDKVKRWIKQRRNVSATAR